MDRVNTITVATPEPQRFEVSADVRTSLGALALAVNHGLDEEQLRVTAYALRDVSVSLLRRACLKLAETEHYWPKPIDIRTCANGLARADAAAAATRHLPPTAGEKTYQCSKCLDDEHGWMLLMECPAVRCERRKPHGPHYFTTRCPCWLRKHSEALKLARQNAVKDNKAAPPECELLDDLERGLYRWDKPSEFWARG